jgi:hypothetical protein
MKAGFATLAALALLASSTGCAMCRNPFDYCGPVVGASGCPNCDFGARRGSIIAPMDGIPATTALEPTPATSPSDARPSDPPQDETPPGRTAQKGAGNKVDR